MSHKVTLIPGDGVGPELVEATRFVLDARRADRLGSAGSRARRDGEGRHAAAGGGARTRFARIRSG